MPSTPRQIAIIQGHPDPRGGHFGHALADAYAESARAAGHIIAAIDVATLDFPLLRNRDELERGEPPACIRDAQSAILHSDHVLLIYPVWNGAMPAFLKGFMEQTFRPGFIFPDAKSGEAKDAPSAPPMMMAFVATPPAPPPPPPPPPPAAPAAAARNAGPRPAATAGRLAAPIEAPREIRSETGTAGVTGGVPGGVEGGIPGGMLGGVVGGLAPPSPPPPPPPPPRAPVRVGGSIQAPILLHRIEPVYPPSALAAKIGGVVILEAVVDESGRVTSVKTLRSHPTTRTRLNRGRATVEVLSTHSQRRATELRADRDADVHGQVIIPSTCPPGLRRTGPDVAIDSSSFLCCRARLPVQLTDMRQRNAAEGNFPTPWKSPQPNPRLTETPAKTGGNPRGRRGTAVAITE